MDGVSGAHRFFERRVDDLNEFTCEFYGERIWRFRSGVSLLLKVMKKIIGFMRKKHIGSCTRPIRYL